jgi:hypothetical protein
MAFAHAQSLPAKALSRPPPTLPNRVDAFLGLRILWPPPGNGKNVRKLAHLGDEIFPSDVLGYYRN